MIHLQYSAQKSSIPNYLFTGLLVHNYKLLYEVRGEKEEGKGRRRERGREKA